MNTFDAILSRRCYRGTYLDTPVPREHLKQIMEAGLAAPSGCNMQTTSLVAVDDPAVLASLWDAAGSPVSATAPAVICVLTRRIVAHRGRCYATQDYAAAIENILLAATELGYMSCWYEGRVTDVRHELAAVLGAPEDCECVCVLPIGVAAGELPVRDKKPFEERAGFNAFPKE